MALQPWPCTVVAGQQRRASSACAPHPADHSAAGRPATLIAVLLAAIVLGIALPVQPAAGESGAAERWLSDEATANSFPPSVFTEPPLRFLLVDAFEGNDSSCSAIDLVTASNDTALQACATIARAMRLADGSARAWVQLRPGQHFSGEIRIPPAIAGQARTIVISSNTPQNSNSSGFIFPAADPSAAAPVWTCAAGGRCLLLDEGEWSSNSANATSSSLAIEGVSFRPAAGFHALVHIGSGEVLLRRCTFLGGGGALQKRLGSVRAELCTVEYARSDGNDTSILSGRRSPLEGLAFHLANVTSLALTRVAVAHSAIEGSFPDRGGVVVFEAGEDLRVNVTIEDCLIHNNTMINGLKRRDGNIIIGGVGVQIRAALASIDIVRTNFTDNTHHGAGVYGVALSVFPLGTRASNLVSLAVVDSVFSRNIAVRPLDWAGSCGGALAVQGVDASSDRYLLTQVLYSGAAVRVERSHFVDNAANGGGAVWLSPLSALSIANCTFRRNSADIIGGALRLWQGTHPFEAAHFFMINTLFDGNTMRLWDGSGGTMYLENVREMTLESLTVRDSIAALYISVTPTVAALVLSRVNIYNSKFHNCSSGTIGGALVVASVSATIRWCHFENNRAAQAGGAVVGRVSASISLRDSTFINNYVQPDPLHNVDELRKEGGAVYVSSGMLSVRDCSFIGSSVLPLEGMAGCEELFLPSSGTAVDFRGGAINVQEVTFDLSTSIFRDNAACAGAAVFVSGRQALTVFNEFYGGRAWAGAALVMNSGIQLLWRDNHAENNYAEAAGGTLSISSVALVDALYSTTTNSTVRRGDGGAIWLGQRSSHSGLSVTGNTFTDCAAPQGGGGILFVALTVASTASALPFVLGPDYMDDNTYAYDLVTGPEGAAAWGPFFASKPVALLASFEALDIFPGLLLSSSGPTLFANASSSGVNITVRAVDTFNQTVALPLSMAARALVVQVGVQHRAGASEGEATPVIRGTVLRQLEVGLAAFTDLTVAAAPGEYELTFDAVDSSVPTLRIPLRVSADCPRGLFYDAKQRVCTTCAAEIHVFDPASQSCVPCAAGWAIAPPSAAQPQATCLVCPLGRVSSAGGECAPCGANTYSPAPGAPCESCLADGMDGLDCSDSLARVRPGWFAFSLPRSSGDGQSGSLPPFLQTAQCPEGFCAGGAVQSAWIDPGSFSNGSSVSLLPAAASAVTRFDQCAFPRAAREDNVLCGQCVEGYIPWENKCARCDSTNGGMVALLVVLSLGLVLFLLRSAVASSSSAAAGAGNSVVVLYFVQTAMLEVGGASKLISWLNIALLSPNSIGECIAPLSPYGQSVLQLLMPLMLVAEMWAVAAVHAALKLWHERRYGVDNSSGAEGEGGDGGGGAARSRLGRLLRGFSPDHYVAASLGVLLFCYTQVTAACLRYLACVDVGGVAVVFTQPSMRCASDDYRRTLPLVVAVILVYVAGFPLSVLFFLGRRLALMRDAHRLMHELGVDEEDKAASGAGAAGAGVGGVAPLAPGQGLARGRGASMSPLSAGSSKESARRFLRRYSPLFAMYARRAWYWPVVLLARRTAFVAIHVTLVRTPELQFMGYTLAHLASMLLQLYSRPFLVEFFNRAELAAHVLLIVLSVTLTAMQPPYTNAVQIFVFCVVLPPTIIYVLAVVARSLRARSEQRRLGGVQRAPLAGSSHNNNPNGEGPAVHLSPPAPSVNRGFVSPSDPPRSAPPPPASSASPSQRPPLPASASGSSASPVHVSRIEMHEPRSPSAAAPIPASSLTPLSVPLQKPFRALAPLPAAPRAAGVAGTVSRPPLGSGPAARIATAVAAAASPSPLPMRVSSPSQPHGAAAAAAPPGQVWEFDDAAEHAPPEHASAADDALQRAVL